MYFVSALTLFPKASTDRFKNTSNYSDPQRSPEVMFISVDHVPKAHVQPVTKRDRETQRDR